MIVYRLNGEAVSREEFLRVRRWRPGDIPGCNRSNCWPMASDAMGVHPDQIAEVMEYDRKHGVPTEYTADGRPILTSREHRKRYAEAHRFFDRNGGYGDPQRR